MLTNCRLPYDFGPIYIESLAVLKRVTLIVGLSARLISSQISPNFPRFSQISSQICHFLPAKQAGTIKVILLLNSVNWRHSPEGQFKVVKLFHVLSCFTPGSPSATAQLLSCTLAIVVIERTDRGEPNYLAGRNSPGISSRDQNIRI